MSEMSTTTLVTALLNSADVKAEYRDPSKYFELFKPLAESGINLIVFMSAHLMPNAVSLYPGVRFEPVILEELESHQVAFSDNTRLPDHHNAVKDTRTYMAIINAKTELMLRAIKLDRPKTTHYGWIDFGISHVLSDPATCLARLKHQCEHLLSPLLVIPGCWASVSHEQLTRGVVWRFCGGFFVGDVDSVRRFCELAAMAYQTAVKKTGVVTWEVNTWARLELEYGWKPEWFQADHNDSMLCIPAQNLRE